MSNWCGNQGAHVDSTDGNRVISCITSSPVGLSDVSAGLALANTLMVARLAGECETHMIPRPLRGARCIGQQRLSTLISLAARNGARSCTFVCENREEVWMAGREC